MINELQDLMPPMIYKRVICRNDVIVLKEFPLVGTDEGRAMMQIVHDIAPTAELYFRTGFVNAEDFAKGIVELADAGCNVISDDVTYFAQPFFRDGVVSKAVDAVVANGVSYFTSAGNFGNKAYESVYAAAPAPAVVSTLIPGATAHNFGAGDILQKVKLAKGSYTIVLQWDDDFYSAGGTNNNGAVNDLDIYLTKNDGSTFVWI